MLVEAKSSWARIDRAHIKQSWTAQVPRITVLLAGVQLAGARDADAYVTEALDAQGIDPVADAQVWPGSMTGTASDGRDMGSLLVQPSIATLAALEGSSESDALATGWATLQMMLLTQVADAFRVAASLAFATHRHATSYVRVLTPPSCSRCAVLAGDYSWSEAFQRHPLCDCTSLPTSEDTRKSFKTSPRDYFASLSKADQERYFTVDGARAIRDGADIGRVVNARRKASGLTPAQGNLTDDERTRLIGGRQRGRLSADELGRFLTFESTGRRQRITRLMPESIYAQTGSDKELAIQLLRKYKYIY